MLLKKKQEQKKNTEEKSININIIYATSKSYTSLEWKKKKNLPSRMKWYKEKNCGNQYFVYKFEGCYSIGKSENE